MDRTVTDDGKFGTAEAWMLEELLKVIDDMSDGVARRLVSWARMEEDAEFPGPNREWVPKYVLSVQSDKEERK